MVAVVSHMQTDEVQMYRDMLAAHLSVDHWHGGGTISTPFQWLLLLARNTFVFLVQVNLEKKVFNWWHWAQRACLNLFFKEKTKMNKSLISYLVLFNWKYFTKKIVSLQIIIIMSILDSLMAAVSVFVNTNMFIHMLFWIPFS